MVAEAPIFITRKEHEYVQQAQPAYINPDTGILAIADKGDVLTAEQTALVILLVNNGKATSSEMRRVVLNSSDLVARKPGNNVDVINRKVKRLLSPEELQEPTTSLLIGRNLLSSSSSEYFLTRPVHVIEIGEIDELGIAQFPAKFPTRSRINQVPNTSKGATDNHSPKISFISDVANIFDIDNTLISIPGAQGAIVKHLMKQHTYVSEEELNDIITETLGRYGSVARVQNAIKQLRRRFPPAVRKSIITKQVINDTPHYRIGIIIEKIQKTPHGISRDQAIALSTLIRCKEGALIQRNREHIQFSLDENTISGVIDGFSHMEPSSPFDQNQLVSHRRKVLRSIELFLLLPKDKQKEFIEKQEIAGVKPLLQWILEENNSGILRGAFIEFLRSNQLGKSITDLVPGEPIALLRIFRTSSV